MFTITILATLCCVAYGAKRGLRVRLQARMARSLRNGLGLLAIEQARTLRMLARDKRVGC